MQLLHDAEMSHGVLLCYVWFLGLISLKIKNLLFDSSNACEDDSGDVHNG